MLDWVTFPEPADLSSLVHDHADERGLMPNDLRDPVKRGDGSIVYHGLKQGVALKTITGAVVLVGEVNSLGGVCDDCTYAHEKIVAYSRTLLDILAAPEA